MEVGTCGRCDETDVEVVWLYRGPRVGNDAATKLCESCYVWVFRL